MSYMGHSSNAALLVFPLLLLLPSLLSAQRSFETSTFTFGGPFKSTDGNTLTVLKDASINGGALQLTPDTRNNIPYIIHKSGRVVFSRRFKLWDYDTSNSSSVFNGSSSSDAKVVASFNTSFNVNIFRDLNVTVVGEGLAFVIVPDLNEPPPGSEGGFLGLTNATTDGSPSNHLVAVELDTLEQSHDRDSNHIGLDINGVRSIASASLEPLGIVLSPVNATNYTVWIDYSGPARLIRVYMAKEGSPKPSSPVLEEALDLSEHLLQHSYFGFSGSTGERYQLNCVLSWSLSVEIIPEDDDTKVWKWVLIIGVPVAVVLILATVVVAFYRHKRKVSAAADDDDIEGTLKMLPGMPKEYRYADLKKGTDGFAERNKLGEGGFGVVYRGKVAGVEGDVAVKTFSKESRKEDFLAELTIINRLRHRHLVRLLGWCYENQKLLLVYEYMPNGSLDWHLHSSPPDQTLPWGRRLTIVSGLASALHYLHNEYDVKVIHRDIKPSNVLLDAEYHARLGDFGLARAIDHGRTSYVDARQVGMPGTLGYIAPECFHQGKATRESDVFAFGAVVLEVVCGRKPWEAVGVWPNLADWVWMLYREGTVLEAVDEKLNGEYEEGEAERLLLLGLACSHPEAEKRPKTQGIVQVVSGSVPAPFVPHFRPPFVWVGTATTGENGGTSSTVALSLMEAMTSKDTDEQVSVER